MLTDLRKYLNDSAVYAIEILENLIYKSALCKARIVTRDELENGQREMLNLGHTFGHAIERSLGYKKLYHGGAGRVGLLAAVELSGAVKTGYRKAREPYKAIIEEGLQLIGRCRLYVNDIIKAMSQDKKRRDENLRFVLLERPGKPFITARVKKLAVRQALKRAVDYYHRIGE